jgi:hypothetical protein
MGFTNEKRREKNRKRKELFGYVLAFSERRTFSAK